MRKCIDPRTAELVDAGLRFAGGHVIHKNCIGNPCEVSAHAEVHLLGYCLAKGISLDGEMILTSPPCEYCAKLLIASKVEKIRIKKRPANALEERVLELLAVAIPVTVENEGKTSTDNADNSKAGKSSRFGS